MTSASELFYTRRSRNSRADVDLDPGSSLSRSFHQNHQRRDNQTHHHRREWDGCHTFRRLSEQGRRSIGHASLFEHPSFMVDQGSNESIRLNGVYAENLSRPSSSGRERLPGAVLLARQRLRERLRGITASTDRQNRQALYRSQSGISDPPFDKKPKPPGLTPESFKSLPKETFMGSVEGKDCSICLDAFTQGDSLVRLPCGHKFHSLCLYPWVTTCGDCPCCRKSILPL